MKLQKRKPSPAARSQIQNDSPSPLRPMASYWISSLQEVAPARGSSTRRAIHGTVDGSLLREGAPATVGGVALDRVGSDLDALEVALADAPLELAVGHPDVPGLLEHVPEEDEPEQHQAR